MRDENANWCSPCSATSASTRAGVICVDRVDAALTSEPLAGGDHAALRCESAPVWEMVEAVIRAGQEYTPSFYILILLTIAGLIGAVGVITNSPVLIVAAMDARAGHSDHQPARDHARQQ